jgi:predicted DsbA family dithiol-disulfide isomerase
MTVEIEIWSDVMCPFCYIGKRHLEESLKLFPDTPVRISWKSFQLDPTISPQPGKDVYSYLAERKGMSVDQSRSLHADVAKRAAAVGLDYQFDKTIIANSWKAHRMIQLAKQKGHDDQIEERLFLAYFTRGEDLNDENTLMRLGVEIGLNPLDIREAISTDIFDDAIRSDIQEAQEFGVRGVPFFVFNRKYAISGAQPVEVFTETIQAVIQESY